MQIGVSALISQSALALPYFTGVVIRSMLARGNYSVMNAKEAWRLRARRLKENATGKNKILYQVGKHYSWTWWTKPWGNVSCLGEDASKASGKEGSKTNETGLRGERTPRTAQKRTGAVFRKHANRLIINVLYGYGSWFFNAWCSKLMCFYERRTVEALSNICNM